MSKLSRADYTQSLAGRVIRRVHWLNYADEDCPSLVLEFEDDTLLSFKFKPTFDETAELSTITGGKMSSIKLVPLPLVRATLKTLKCK